MPGCCTQLNRLLSTLQHRPARWLQNASVTEHLPKGAALTVQQFRRETGREKRVRMGKIKGLGFNFASWYMKARVHIWLTAGFNIWTQEWTGRE